MPPAAEVVDQVMDLDLGADVDAPRRLVEDQHLRLRLQPLADDDLLLVAAGERRGRRVDRRRADAQPLAKCLGRGAFFIAAHETSRRQKPRQRGQRDVRRDREGHDQAELAAVFGAVGDAELHRVARVGDAHRRAVEPDLARVGGRDAEQREADVGAPRADQPGEPKHLPGPQLERDVLKRTFAAETVDGEPHVSRVAAVAPEELLHLAADHAPDGGGGSQLGARRRRHPAAVAQDRHACRRFRRPLRCGAR